jgi:hypothetical protein
VEDDASVRQRTGESDESRRAAAASPGWWSTATRFAKPSRRLRVPRRLHDAFQPREEFPRRADHAGLAREAVAPASLVHNYHS